MVRPLSAALALTWVILFTPLTDACAQAPERPPSQDQSASTERPQRSPRTRASHRREEPEPEPAHPIGKVIEPDSPRAALRKIMMLQSLVDDKLALRGDTRRDVEDKFERFLGVLREAAGAVPSDELADEARELQRKMRQAHEDRDMDEYRRLRTELSTLMRGPEETETPKLAPFLQEIYGKLESEEARRYVHLLGRLDLVEVDEDDEIPLRKFIRLLLAPQVDLSNDQRQAVGSLIKEHKEGLTDPKLTPYERRKAFEQFRDAIYSHLNDEQREMIENRLNPPKRPERLPDEEEDAEMMADRDGTPPSEAAPTASEATAEAAAAAEQAKEEAKAEEATAEKPAEGEAKTEEAPKEAETETKEEPPAEPQTPEKQEPEPPQEQPVEPEPEPQPEPEPPAPEEPAPEPVREEPPPPAPEQPAPQEEKPAPVEQPEKPKEQPAPKPEKETPPKEEPKKEPPAPAPPKKPVDRDRPPESKDKPKRPDDQ